MDDIALSDRTYRENGQKIYTDNFGLTRQDTANSVQRDYVVDYTSAIKNDLMVYEDGGFKTSYTYGANGRISQMTRHLEDEINPVTGKTISTTANAKGENINSDIAVEKLGKLYYHLDRLGSTAFITDESGMVRSYATYDEWGDVREGGSHDVNIAGVDATAGFTTYTYDKVLDKYFAQYRMYDAENKRFTAEDPIKSGVNWYGYVGNRPLVMVDPWGLELSPNIYTTHAMDPWRKNPQSTTGDPIPIEKPVVDVSKVEQLLDKGDNRRIIEYTEILYDLAEQYAPMASNQHHAELTLQVIRQSNYYGSKWDTTAGEFNTSFIEYVRENNSSTYDYFQVTENIYFTDLSCKKIDYKHLSATLNAHIYSSSWRLHSKDGWLATAMSEYTVNSLSGWAGDLQTFMIDLQKEVGNANNNYQTVYNKAREMFGNEDTSFSWADFYADTDAKNLDGMLDRDTTLITALYAYYTEGYSERMQTFIGDKTKAEIRAQVEPFTAKTVVFPFDVEIGSLKNEWPLMEGWNNYSSEFERAVTDAFTDILYSALEAERKG